MITAKSGRKYGRRYPVRPGGSDDIMHKECDRFVSANPVIAASAPAWARIIEVVEAWEDGSGSFFYVFDDEKFEVVENWHIESDGSLTYGSNNDDEPEISCKGDALLELVANYIEGTGK